MDSINTYISQWWTATQVVTPPTLGIIKIAVGLILLRINVNKIIKYILIVSMTITGLFTTVIFFILVFQCRPLSLMWGVGQGTCIDIETNLRAGMAFFIIDLIFNWLYSLIPIPMLWKIQIDFRTKIGVLVLFGLGIV